MDVFSAQILLSATGVCKSESDVNQLADLHKNLENNPDGGPSQEAIDFFEKNKGKKCKIKNTAHIGIIYQLNTSEGGFYPGGRYPIYVKITNEGAAKGYVFEYGLDQIQIIEE